MPSKLGSTTIFILLMVILFGAINTLSTLACILRLIISKSALCHGRHSQEEILSSLYSGQLFVNQNIPVYLVYSFALLLFAVFKRVKKDQYLKREKEAEQQGKVLQYPKMKVCFGGILDLTASILNAISLNYVSGSLYQMLRAGTIAATFFFSICYLKKTIKKYQILGIILTLIGSVIVGISNLIYKTSSPQ